MHDNEIDTLIETLIDISGMYYECSAQLDGLATAVRAREK